LSKNNKPIESECQESRTFEVAVQPCGLLGADMARPPPRIGIAGCPLQHLVPALIFFRRVAPTPLLCTLTFSVDLSHLASSVLQSGLISLDQLSRIWRELKIGTRLNPNFADLSVKSMGFQNSNPVRKKKIGPGRIRRISPKPSDFLLTLAGCLSDCAGVALHLIL
jgi:hypothetical protein